MERGTVGYKSVCNRPVRGTEFYFAAIKVVADLTIKSQGKPGVALQFVSNIYKFQREAKVYK